MGGFLGKKNIWARVVILILVIGGLFYFYGKTNESGPNTNISNILNLSKSKQVGSGKLLKKSVNKCENIPKLPDGAKKLVTKVIDGDTFLIEGGYSVRILGIDADERGYPCYDEAKRGLEDLVLGKEVRLEAGKKDLDQYCRYLRYVFVNDKNVSLEMVKNGLVVARFSPKDTKYREEITLAEKLARENKVGCKWGKSKN
jgi:micrococcal nuclease